MTVHLIACVKKKATVPTEARDMYQSVWFRKARAYVEMKGGAWWILSAKHGVLAPNTVIEPYEQSLHGMDAVQRRAWATQVLDQLRARLPARETVVLLCGTRYRENLMEVLGARAQVPMRGLGVGQQLAWLNRELGHE